MPGRLPLILTGYVVGSPLRTGELGARLIEAATAGLAFSAVLCWGGTCLVASFRPDRLAAPYWAGIPALRTDTSGVMAFFVAAICITASEYLRLRRRRVQGALEASAHPPSQSDREAGDARLFTLAAAKAVTVLCTGLVVYLSVNAVTHPATLEMQVTHLSPWPTEGTVRVAALALCALATAARRFLGTATASLAR